ncbi:MAG: hypothetical protein ABFD50_10370 [Smithella sp.]
MQFFNKLRLLIIVFFISFSGISFTYADGIVFDWQPFKANDFQDLNHSKKILSSNSLIIREISRKINNYNEFLPNNSELKNNYPETLSGKSALSKIKVSFSTVSSFMLPYDEIHARGYEEKISRAASALPSFLRNPSQEMAIETLKLIEPQVNLGFEF